MTTDIDLVSLEFFGKGKVLVNSLEEFLCSDAGSYLKNVYGDLEFTQSKSLNFIKVSKYENKFIISENIFSEVNTLGQDYGTILPKSLIQTKIFQEFNRKSNELNKLSEMGYCELDYQDSYAKDLVRESIKKLNFVRFSEKIGYESPDKYVDYVKSTNDNTTIPELDKVNNHIFNMVKLYVGYNPLLELGCISETRIQKMIKGDSLVRHFGASKEEPYIATVLTYFSDGAFLGRELYGGERSFKDLSRYVKNFVHNSNFDPYLDIPLEYIDTYEIVPSNSKVAFVSAFNPRFYHAVKPHLGGDEVYVVITDLRLKK